MMPLWFLIIHLVEVACGVGTLFLILMALSSLYQTHKKRLESIQLAVAELCNRIWDMGGR